MQYFDKYQANVLRAVFFTASIGYAVWIAFFNLYLSTVKGFSGTQIGIITAVQYANTILVLPVWGMLADKFGRKKMLLIAMGGVIVLFWGFNRIDTFAVFLVYMFVFTLFYNPLNTLLDSVTLDFVEQNKIGSYGEFRLWASLGWAITTSIAGLIINRGNINNVFSVSAMLLVGAFSIIWLTYKPLVVKKSLAALRFGLLRNLIFADKRLFPFLIILLVYGIFSAPIHLFINLYYKEIGADYTHVGFAFTAQALFEIPFFFFGGRIVNRFGPRRVILFTMAITVMRMLAYGSISNPWLAIAVGTFHGISLALFMVAVVYYIHQFIPAEWRATGQSFIYLFYFGAGLSIGNAWAGFLTDLITLRKTMWLNAACIIVLISITILIFYRHNKKLKH